MTLHINVWLQVISNLIIEVSLPFSVVEMATTIEGEIAGAGCVCAVLQNTISKTIKEVKPKQLS